jgi:L-serine/L-threonine ammonia-lyase
MYINTPLLRHSLHDKTFFLKMDCWQPSGSFKLRGMTHLARHHQVQGIDKLVSSSGGNAGYSAAWAARELGMSITVVVPETTPKAVQERIAAIGAEVMVRGAVWEEAHAFAGKIAAEQQGALVHPFEHPILWEGHSTLVDEVGGSWQFAGSSSGLPTKPDAVVVAVGGGGLLNGLMLGMHRQGWHDVPVYAAETEGAASYAAALEAGKPVRIPAINSIAKSLGANQVSDTAFNWSQKHDIRSLVVSDDEALESCRHFADDFRVLVEPACGAALSGMYFHQEVLGDAENILVVVCGGIGVNLSILC